jgi:hypothetical protein
MISLNQKKYHIPIIILNCYFGGIALFFPKLKKIEGDTAKGRSGQPGLGRPVK